MRSGHTETGKKKVLILANSSAGLYDFRNELVQRLLAEYEVVASLPDAVKTKALRAEGCRVVETPLHRRGTNPVQDLALLQSYRRLLRREKPALVLTYTIKPNVYGGMACAAAGVPCIATVTGLGSAFQKKGMLLRMVRTLYRRGLRHAACVFFQNGENKRLFEAYGLLHGRSRLVPGSGVNLEKHPQAPYPEGETVRFLYVGRMMREKGIEEYLAAAKALHAEHVRFGILGYCDEAYGEKLAAAERAGEITLLGFDPEVQGYYARCSAVVLPTYHEGMSNVLMEASAAGRPVIATDIPGCREIFEEGKTGFGCRARDAQSLIAALQRFLSLSAEERGAMGAAAHEKMVREFDRRAVVAAYEEELKKVL